MTLDELHKEILSAVMDSICESDGGIYASVDIPQTDGSLTTIEVFGNCEIYGYYENDYYNGTGNWVTTRAEIKIDSIEACAVDANDNDIDNDITTFAKRISTTRLEIELAEALKCA